ncbi:MAG: PorV/PorQ family protein [Elusimicrobia bacterium]|nr:PorV/PorQ family protein [Elusimicrobiota bacterium]
MKRDVGVRAMGLGGAYAGIADDASALYWNPSGIQQIPRQEIQFMHAEIFVDQTEDFLAYVRPHWRRGERETFGLTVSRLAQGNFDVVDEGESAGTAAPSETVVGVSYARPFGPGAWGLTGKWVRQDLFDQQGNAYALDLGYQANVRNWGYGLALANVGTAMTLGDVRTELPLVLRAGAARKNISVGRGALTLAAQVDLPADDRLRGRLGVEWARLFAEGWRGSLRSGYRTDGSRFTLGAGVTRGGIELNYAYALNGELGASNLFDLTFRFGPRLKEETRRQELIAATGEALDQGNLAQASTNLNALETLSPRARALSDLRARLNQNLAETIDPALLWRQGEEAKDAKKWEAAVLLYRKLLIVQPDHAGGKKALQEVERAIDQARTVAAQEAVRKARQRETRALAERARSATARGDWAVAMKEWRLATRHEGPGGPLSIERDRMAARLYDAARKAEEAGRNQQALDLYRLLAEEDPPVRDSAQRLARLLEKLSTERRSQGKTLYEEGLTLYRSGDRAGARKLFEQALVLDPENRAIQRALERLRQETPLRTTP